jgi:threonine/homoserine/homoserine lactone efflux protein
MVPTNDLLLFAGAALLMVLTPGPNMIYLISRSICQGRKAGVISLFGVIAGFLVHMFAAAIGLAALRLAADQRRAA